MYVHLIFVSSPSQLSLLYMFFCFTLSLRGFKKWFHFENQWMWGKEFMPTVLLSHLFPHTLCSLASIASEAKSTANCPYSSLF